MNKGYEKGIMIWKEWMKHAICNGWDGWNNQDQGYIKEGWKYVGVGMENR